MERHIFPDVVHTFWFALKDCLGFTRLLIKLYLVNNLLCIWHVIQVATDVH